MTTLSQFRRYVAATALAFLAGGIVTSTVAAQVCECQFGQSNERGHIAGAFGGGLFAGLVAAVLHIKHTHEASLQPSQDPIVASDLGVAPAIGPVFETSAGSLAEEPTAAGKNAGPGAGKSAGPLRDVAVAPGHNGPSGGGGRVAPSRHGPRLSANEARNEGLIPPKTATMMPAYALIGAGSLLLGLFLLRQRSDRRRRWH